MFENYFRFKGWIISHCLRRPCFSWVLIKWWDCCRCNTRQLSKMFISVYIPAWYVWELLMFYLLSNLRLVSLFIFRKSAVFVIISQRCFLLVFMFLWWLIAHYQLLTAGFLAALVWAMPAQASCPFCSCVSLSHSCGFLGILYLFCTTFQ